MRATRVEATGSPVTLDGAIEADYVDAFQLRISESSGRSAEQWARDALEGAPRLLRWLVLFGWRAVLGLELGPRPSADHVMGWRIVPVSSEATVLVARSGLLTAHLSFQVEGSCVTWRTFVHHEHRASRLVWAPVGLLHRRIVPYVLEHAASHPSLSGAGAAVSGPSRRHLR